MPVVRLAFNGRVLIERDQEVDRLLELLADAVDGEGRLVFVGGEAGVGKTSLVSAVATLEPLGDGHELAMAYSTRRHV